jgi:hypothetical protein
VTDVDGMTQALGERPETQNTDRPRRSQREHRPTEASLPYCSELAKKSEGAFCKAYGSLKSLLLGTRDSLKEECSEEELFACIERIERAFERLEKAYGELKSHISEIEWFTPYQRKIDTASACKEDMILHLHYRVSKVGVKPLTLEEKLEQLRALKKPYAASGYSSVTASSCHSEAKSIREIVIAATADLAAKRVRV